MGRRAIGRKYAKHISIQVREEHNDDLKFLAQKLNKSTSLPNAQKWTIRDIVLTLLYSQYNNSPIWFTKNHFEQLSDKILNDIRRDIRSLDDGHVESTDNEPEKVERQERVKIKKIPQKQPMLQIKLDPEYETYVNKIRSIQQEEEL